MAKRESYKSEPPAISKEQGRKALAVMREKAKTMIGDRPIREAALDTWTTSTSNYLKQVFGSESDHLGNFFGPVQTIYCGSGHVPNEDQLEQERFEDLSKRLAVLSAIIDQLETDIAIEIPGPGPTSLDQEAVAWSLLHPQIVKIAKPRFQGGHFADAVEAAFKELNSRIKEIVKRKTTQELDGASLMQKAFSPNPPVLIALDDLSTESGKNIQQGYMQIFAGAMIGIRNPKAHANLQITKERALHLLFLASLLSHKLDEGR